MAMNRLASILAVLLMASAIDAAKRKEINFKALPKSKYEGEIDRVNVCLDEDDRARSIYNVLVGSNESERKILMAYKSVRDKICFLFGQNLHAGSCRNKQVICDLRHFNTKIYWATIAQWDFVDTVRLLRSKEKKYKVKKVISGLEAKIKTRWVKYHISVINYQTTKNEICNIYLNIWDLGEKKYITCTG